MTFLEWFSMIVLVYDDFYLVEYLILHYFVFVLIFLVKVIEGI